MPSNSLRVPSDTLAPPADVGASASSSSTLPPPTLSLLPSNVLSIFLARFHVRNGNQIDFQRPAPLGVSPTSKLIDTDDGIDAVQDSASGDAIDLSGVEWKVLPSGGHLIERDVIYFQPNAKAATSSSTSVFAERGQVGVACFRNFKLDTLTGTSSSASASPSTGSGERPALDQRGARMISVGLVLSCHSSETGVNSPTAQQLAIVPHLDNLEKLADQLVQDPEQTQLLKAYYEAHAAKRPKENEQQNGSAEATMSATKMRQLRMRMLRNPKNLYHDPTSHLPAMCNALGPLLPAVLKKLMIQGHRLLILAPAPPLVQAAYIGYNLADLVIEALPLSSRKGGNLVPVCVRGQVGVHDILALEDEEKAYRKRSCATLSSGDANSVEYSPSWIAWSSDKILLEKTHLFDTVLDLSTLVSSGSGGHLDEDSLVSSSACAKLLRISRTPIRGQEASNAYLPVRVKAEVKKQSWTTREFATFNELDAQAERHADRTAILGGRRKGSNSKRKASKSSLRRSYEDGKSDHGGSIRRKSSGRLDGADAAFDGEPHSRAMTRSESALSQWRGGCARSPRRTPGGVMSAILAFLRYWLVGWWFLPSHWRYGLPSSYVLPLGIRGDGGVRSSIMIMPVSDEDEDEDASSSDCSTLDDREAGERSCSKGAPSPRASSSKAGAVRDAGLTTGSGNKQDGDSNSAEAGEGEGTGTAVTNSTESTISAGNDDDDDDRDRDLDLMGPPDPLLAAVGASVPFNHHHHHHHHLSDGRRSPAASARHSSGGVSSGDDADDDDDDATSSSPGCKSKNSSHSRRTPSRRTVGSVSSGRGYGRRLSFDRFGNHLPCSASLNRGGATSSGDDDDHEDGEEGAGVDWELILSDSLWTVWSRWTRALVHGLVEILREEREKATASPSTAAVGESNETTRLLDPTSSSRSGAVVTIRMGAKEMASLGLSAANEGDVELVRSLARKALERLDRPEDGGSGGRGGRTTWNVEVEKVWPVLKWFL